MMQPEHIARVTQYSKADLSWIEVTVRSISSRPFLYRGSYTEAELLARSLLSCDGLLWCEVPGIERAISVAITEPTAQSIVDGISVDLREELKRLYSVAPDRNWELAIHPEIVLVKSLMTDTLEEYVLAPSDLPDELLEMKAWEWYLRRVVFEFSEPLDIQLLMHKASTWWNVWA